MAAWKLRSIFFPVTKVFCHNCPTLSFTWLFFSNPYLNSPLLKNLHFSCLAAYLFQKRAGVGGAPVLHNSGGTTDMDNNMNQAPWQ